MAVCLSCETECEGGPQGTGGQGSGEKWWAREMTKHLQKYHLDNYKAFRRAELNWIAEKEGRLPEDLIKSVLQKEEFRQALLELKAESVNKGSLDAKHVKISVLNEKLKCNMCPDFFKKMFTLKRHIRIVHKKCEVCGFESDNRIEMKLHIATHVFIYKCQICIKSYPKDFSLKLHVETAHEGKRFNCKICDHTSSIKASIKDHMKRLHQTLKVVCSLCKRKFSNQVILDNHIKTKHEGQKTILCSMCSFTTAFEWKLQQHKKGKHEGECVINRNGRFTCPYCNYTSKEKCAIRSHIKIHHDNVRVVCDLCPSKFLHRLSMETHKRSAHFGEIFKCNLCPSKMYKQKEALKQHNDIKHKGKTYTCNTCDYIATRKVTLLYHIDEKHTHPNDQKRREYCQVCPKSFKNSSLLKYHMMYHNDERPLSCQKCLQRFRQPGTLRKHIRSFHSTITLSTLTFD